MNGPVAAGRPTSSLAVVLAVMVCLIPSGTAVGFYANGLFVKPVTDAFGWSRSTYFAAWAVAGVIAAVTAPVIGYLADRFGVRRTLLPGIVAYGAAMAALATLTGSTAQYYLLTAAASILSTFQGPLLYSKVVSAWADRRRGLALAVALSGTAIGGILVPPYVTALIGEFGWRAARIALGITVVAVALPVAFIWVREPPARASGPNPVLKAGDTVGQALRSHSFWMLGAALMLSGLAINGVLANMAPLLGDRGMGVAAAAALSSVAGAQVAGRFMAGQLLDRTATPKVAIACFAAGMLGVLLLAISQSVPMAILAAVFIGLGLGSEMELASYFVGRFFGLREFGQIFGIILAIFLISVATGPYFMALAFDTFGDYRLGLMACEGVLALACVAIWLAGPYRHPSGQAVTVREGA